ncbi:hypothetical protein SDC9_198106 [bioreactor metagenome]|uniref:Uncharacterized protein n=1 Tax=bioreactor metagenome TaxID=1076179 RepID=A0A645IJ19_9ZZZZ
MEPEVEVAAEQAVAEHAGFFGVAHRGQHAVDGERVFGANVDIAFIGPDGAGGDHHAFDDGVRVAFHDRAVHERARVALVAVADDELLGVLRSEGELPFEAGRETAAAAPAQA